MKLNSGIKMIEPNNVYSPLTSLTRYRTFLRVGTLSTTLVLDLITLVIICLK